ncbi:MAG: tyrosine-type recombinase/integrase [Nocardiaceae bacterium]|nr:tyrosine-type recombinase/integrase [Nocardiaceae bacterium]
MPTATLVNFYRWAIASGLLDTSPADALPTIKPAKPRPQPVAEIIYREALARSNPRSRMMLRLAAECGMRRGEVCQAHTRDVIEDLTGWSIIVHGKGGKQRVVPLPDDLAVELYVYKKSGYFFPGRIDGHLSDRYVGTIVARLLPGKRTMHKLRHKFATDAFAIDSNIVVVQELLGHESPVTTRAYVALPDDALRKTITAMQERRRAS